VDEKTGGPWRVKYNVPMPDFDVTYDLSTATVTLRGLEERSQNLRLAHQMVGEMLYGNIMTNFEQEIDPYGVKWLENSPWTRNEKQRLGRIMKVLQSTGVMKARTSYRVLSDRVTIGNYDAKAYKHQEGINTPQRIIIGVSEADLEDIRFTYYDYITGELGL